MSASLVGSEMCIRDRSFATREDVRCVQGEISALRRLRGGSGWAGLAGGICLLYTSDAADDM
eukprot:10563669-Alexandrium_andersonii.AAC.1